MWPVDDPLCEAVGAEGQVTLFPLQVPSLFKQSCQSMRVEMRRLT